VKWIYRRVYQKLLSVYPRAKYVFLFLPVPNLHLFEELIDILLRFPVGFPEPVDHKGYQGKDYDPTEEERLVKGKTSRGDVKGEKTR
jgi:hypothetical protein